MWWKKGSRMTREGRVARGYKDNQPTGRFNSPPAERSLGTEGVASRGEGAACFLVPWYILVASHAMWRGHATCAVRLCKRQGCW